MNKHQAMMALRQQHKITHLYFADGEWVHMPDCAKGILVFEDGAQQGWEEFWKLRDSECFDSDWEIVNSEDK